MEEKKHVTYGSCLTCSIDSEVPLTGCRFSIFPMSDRYIDIILGAVEKTDTEKIWSGTDELSTVYRGKRIHVLDALKAAFIHARQEGVHMMMEATVSKGCPGDTLADSYLTADDEVKNGPVVADVHFPVLVKFALYPFGVPDYMKHIAHIVNHAVDIGLYERTAHYVTILKGDVQDIFAYFDWAAAYCEKALGHYVIEMTIGVNFPEEQEGQTE